MSEENDLVSRIVSALCDKIANCDECPVSRECGPSGNAFEKLVRKCMKEKREEE